MKFIHAADIHLDSPMLGLERYEGAPVDELRQATRRAFLNMVELAVEEAVDFVLIAGDLYDGDLPDYKAALFLSKAVMPLSDHNIPVLIVSGNHDAASRITKSLRLPPNCHRFSYKEPETYRLEGIGVAVHGQSYPQAPCTDNLAIAYPEALPGLFNVGLLHTSLNGREGHENYAPCRLEDLARKGYDYWALGHVHKQEILRETCLTAFAGNLQGRHFRETGPKGCLLVSVNGAEITVEPQHLDVARWLTVDVDASGCVSYEEALTRVSESIRTEYDRSGSRPLVCRVTLSGRCKAHSKLLTNYERFLHAVRNDALLNGGEQVWIEQVNIHTSSEVDIDRKASGPLAMLLNRIDQLSADDELITGLLRELRQLRAELPASAFSDIASLDLDSEEGVAMLAAESREKLLSLLLDEGER